MVPASLRANMLVVRIAATLEVSERWSELRWILLALRTRVVAASLIVALGALVVTLVADRAEWRPPALEPWTMGLAIGTVGFVALGQLFQGFVESRRWTVRSQLPDVVFRQAVPVIGVGAAVAFGLRVDSFDAAGALLAGAVLFLLAHMALAHAASPRELLNASPTPAPELLRGRLPPLLTAGVLIGITQQAGAVVLGVMASPSEVALYVAASRFATVLLFVPASINVSFSATAASLWARQETQALEEIAARAGLAALLANVLISIPLVLGAELLLGMLGQEFRAAAPLLHLLVLGQLTVCVAGPSGALLVMTGHEREAAIGMGAGAAATLIATVLGVAWFGALGAAAGAIAGTIAWNGMLAHFVRDRLGARVGTIAGIRRLVAASGRSSK